MKPPRQVKHRAATLARTLCAQGHEWTPANLRVDPNGGLHCRLCSNDRSRARAIRIQAEHAKLT